VRYALLSDIHGNLQGLEQVLDELAALRIDEAAPVILGNADDFLLEVPTETNEEITEEQLRRRDWSPAQLEPRHLERIRAFHPTYERDGLLAFHGSPRHFEDVLLPETGDDAPWQVAGYELLAGGHTHTQWTRRIGDALYVNPGAIMSAPAEFAIVNGRSVEFRRCAS
jgi:predicted phosphodiesterase